MNVIDNSIWHRISPKDICSTQFTVKWALSSEIRSIVIKIRHTAQRQNHWHRDIDNSNDEKQCAFHYTRKETQKEWHTALCIPRSRKYFSAATMNMNAKNVCKFLTSYADSALSCHIFHYVWCGLVNVRAFCDSHANSIQPKCTIPSARVTFGLSLFYL